MTSGRVVVVGSANVDLVAYCDRFPDDGETLVGRTFAQGFGGKGANQAVMAARLGSPVTFVGCVGVDSLGAEITANLAAEGIDVSALATVEGVSTGVAPIWVDAAGTNRILIVPGANHAFGPAHVNEALDRLGTAAVVLAQLETPQDATMAAFAWARRVGATTILNPAPAARLAPELLASTDWLVPNEVEFAALAGAAPNAERVAESSDHWGCDVLVTMGEAGVFVGARGAPVVSVPAPVVRSVDSTGAGDAFLGAFAHAVALGSGSVEAARLGCICGALSVTKPGAQQSFPDRAAVEAFLERRRRAGAKGAHEGLPNAVRLWCAVGLPSRRRNPPPGRVARRQGLGAPRRSSGGEPPAWSFAARRLQRGRVDRGHDGHDDAVRRSPLPQRRRPQASGAAVPLRPDAAHHPHGRPPTDAGRRARGRRRHECHPRRRGPSALRRGTRAVAVGRSAHPRLRGVAAGGRTSGRLRAHRRPPSHDRLRAGGARSRQVRCSGHRRRHVVQADLRVGPYTRRVSRRPAPWQRARAVAASLAIFFGIVVVTGVLLGWSDFMYWVFTGTTGYTSVDLSSLPEVGRLAVGMTALLAVSFAGPLLLASAGRKRDLDVELWLASSVLAFLVGFRFLGHYAIQVLPPLTLMALQGCAAGGRRLRWGLGLTVVSAIVWVGLAFVPQRVQPMPNYKSVVGYVDTHSSATDRVFVWGESSELYWSSERLPASRFPHIQFLTDLSPGRANEAPKYDTNATRVAWTDLWTDFVQHPPKLILDTTKVDGGSMETARLESSPLASYMRATFQPVAVLDGVTVYERASVGATPPGDGPLPSSIRLGNHAR